MEELNRHGSEGLVSGELGGLMAPSRIIARRT